MKRITHVQRGAILCILSLSLAGCLFEDNRQAQSQNQDQNQDQNAIQLPAGRSTHAVTHHGSVSTDGNWTTMAQNQLVGGASGVCSSAGQGACNDWSAWAMSNLSDAERNNQALAATEPVALTNAKITALVADPAWETHADFKTGVELILNHLKSVLQTETNGNEYADWQDFRAAFIAVKNDEVANLPSGVDGDRIWFDSSSAQYATFESLKKADERLNYTITLAKVNAAKDVIANLPSDALNDDQAVINTVLDALVSDSTRNQDELLAAIRAVELTGNVLADGEQLWFDLLSNSDQDILYDDWYDFNNYLLNQAAIDYLIERSWTNPDHKHQVQLILDNMLEQFGEKDYNGSWSGAAGARADFTATLISEGFENGGQLWNSLSSGLRFRLLQALIDPLVDFERPIEYVSLDDTTNGHSVTLLNDFVAQARLAGGLTDAQEPRILVMTSSAANSYEAADYYVGMFKQAGADAAWLPLDRAYRDARDEGNCSWLSAYHSAYASAAHLDILYPDYYSAHLDACENGLAAMIAAADGIYINGGDQVRTFAALVTFNGETRQNSAELTQILTRHAAGELVIGGTSAGAAVQSGGRLMDAANVNPMVTAGSPHAVLKTGYNANSAQLAGGMGVFTWGVTDTHFSERARETRLIRLLDHADVRLGFGVDETTALNVRHEKNAADEARVVMTVSGQSGVYVVDYATAQTIADAPFESRYVTTHYLHQGDQLVWYPATETYDIHFSTDRTALPVGKDDVASITTNDVLYQTEYRDLARAMFNAEAVAAKGTSKESAPEYHVSLQVTQHTRAYRLGNQISYAFVEVEIAHNNAQ